MATGERKKLTPAEFLEQERKAEQKHILWNGEVFAMAGGTRAHAALATGLSSELRSQLLPRRCETYGSDMRVHVPSVQGYVYPDVSVVCGPAFGAGPSDTLLNPVLIAEVLSDSSEAFDRGDKFRGYRSIASLRQYLLVSQHAPRIDVFTRDDDGIWFIRSLEAGQTLALEPPGVVVDVDAIFRGVELTPAPPPPDDSRRGGG